MQESVYDDDTGRGGGGGGGGPASAYGSGGATGRFQATDFLKKPQVIVRLFGLVIQFEVFLKLYPDSKEATVIKGIAATSSNDTYIAVFSIVVFGCIFSQGYEKGHCAYGEHGACGYGIFVGLIAFLIAATFLVLDGLFDNISNIMQRKYIVIADIMTASVWSFLYFVCFCYLADSWRRHYEPHFWGKSGVEAAIAFSFFNVGIFVALTVLAVIRYRAGVFDDLSIRSDFDYSSDQYVDSRGGQ